MTDCVTVDCRGMQCPAPILHLAKTARQAAGKPLLLEVMADDSDFPMDLEAWCRTTRSALHRMTCEDGVHRALVGLNGAPAQGAASSGSEPTARVVSQRPPEAAAAPAKPRPPAAAPPAPAPRAQAAAQPVQRPPSMPPREAPRAAAGPRAVDLRGLRAPMPVLQLSQLAAQNPGAHLMIHADDPTFLTDVMSFATAMRATIVNARQADGGSVIELVLPGGAPMPLAMPSPAPAAAYPQASLAVVGAAGSTALAPVADSGRDNRCAILVLHNDFESLMAALLVATASAAQGMEVVVFFSFWGVNLLRGERPRKDVPSNGVSFLQRMMKWMMPKGPKRQKMSKMHMGGMGKGMMEFFMRRNNVMALSELIDSAVEQKVRFIVCSMSMGIMGIEKRDIMDLPNLEFAGVTCFVEESRRAGMSLVF